MNIDSQGNTIVTGLMSDEHDFDLTSERKTVVKTTRYAAGYDISFIPNGDIIALGGGKLGKNADQDLRLFLAKFSTDGEQSRFMWLGKYLNFIHNMGHRIDTNKNGRTYVTALGEKLPPFLLSRDM